MQPSLHRDNKKLPRTQLMYIIYVAIFGVIWGIGTSILATTPRLLRLTEPRLPSCPYHSQGVLLGAQTLGPPKAGNRSLYKPTIACVT
jgi:hypothetical protein